MTGVTIERVADSASLETIIRVDGLPAEIRVRYSASFGWHRTRGASGRVDFYDSFADAADAAANEIRQTARDLYNEHLAFAEADAERDAWEAKNDD